MTKSYQWSLIPYPYLRTFNIFTAFVMNALCVGVISALSIETQAYFVHLEENKYNFKKLQRENNIAGVQYKPERDVFKTSLGASDPYDFRLAFHRAMRVSIVSALISFTVYILLFFIFGFGGGMISMRRQYRLFSDIAG